MDLVETLLKTTVGATTLLLCSAVMNTALAERVYKLNDKGLTVYQDRAPTPSQDTGHQVLNNRGVVMENVKSRDERRKQRVVERKLATAAAHDRALLATFTTVEDLQRTRDERVGMIDGLIERLDDRVKILTERQERIESRIESHEDALGEGNAAESLYEDRASVARNIENAWSLVDAKAMERAEVAKKFDADLKRYRELKAAK